MIDPSVRDVLSDVFDPCCRDKGISVVDMGLLHRAEIDDGAAREDLARMRDLLATMVIRGATKG